jgi:hypothetical protein
MNLVTRVNLVVILLKKDSEMQLYEVKMKSSPLVYDNTMHAYFWAMLNNVEMLHILRYITRYIPFFSSHSSLFIFTLSLPHRTNQEKLMKNRRGRKV